MVLLKLLHLLLLGLDPSVDGKIIETQVISLRNCGNIDPFKNVKIECELPNFELVSKFQIRGFTVPLLLDTGSGLSWVLTMDTRYLLVTVDGNNISTIEDYGKDWTQYFANPPSNISLPDIINDSQLSRTSYADGKIVDYLVDQNPIQLNYKGWGIKLNIRLAVRVMETVKRTNHYSGILGLRYDRKFEIKASLLYQSYYQHNETSKSMISVDINVPPSQSFFGFGQPVTPIGLQRSNVISIHSLSMDWLIEIKYIKLKFMSTTEYCHVMVHNALLDTGAAMIYLPEKLKLNIPAEKRNYTFGETSFPTQRWRLYVPNVHLGIVDKEIIIPKQYLYSVSEGDMRRSMLKSMTPQRIGQFRDYHTILGVAFFSAVYTEFHFNPTRNIQIPNLPRVDMISKTK